VNAETKVFVEFNLELVDATFFTLDDETFGLLDGEYGLGGPALVDVTEFVASVSIGRGKSQELDRFTAGQASVTFHNDNRFFDPFYAESPYFQQFQPRRRVQIRSNDIIQYTGFIDDIDLRYDLGNKSFAIISCSDAFIQLSSADLDTFTNDVEFSGERITTVLNRPEVNWPLDARDIDTGVQILQADTVEDGTNSLQYLQLVEQSEPGALFISKSGDVTFKDRVNIPPLLETISFSDQESAVGVPYNKMEVIYGSENLYNRITITRAGGTAQVAESLESQGIYGIQALTLDGLLVNSDEDALTLASYYVDLYQQPELRFASVGITVHDKEKETQDLILGLEINDAVQVIFTPNGIGEPIAEYALITGINHNISIDQHFINFEFGQITNFPIILDDEEYGRLSGVLPTYNDSGTSYNSNSVKYNGTNTEFYRLAF